MPPRHKDYFLLKGNQISKDSGKVLFLSLNCLNLHWQGGLFQKESYYQRYLFTRKLSYVTGQPRFSKHLLCLPVNGLPHHCIPKPLPLSSCQDVTWVSMTWLPFEFSNLYGDLYNFVCFFILLILLPIPNRSVTPQWVLSLPRVTKANQTKPVSE